MIEAVIFDWGGTLTPWMSVDHLAGWRCLADVLHADDPERAARLSAVLLAAEEARWAVVREEHRAFTLDQVLSDATVNLGTEALDAYRAFWLPATHTDPEAVPMLTALRNRSLSLGVLSSTSWPAAWHEEWLRRDGVLELLDACVWTSDLPWTKPHPSAFRAAMEAIGVTDPAHCVYVGDRLHDDIAGAQAAGMRAVFVPHSDIPEIQRVPGQARPDAVIQRLSDLPDVIADW